MTEEWLWRLTIERGLKIDDGWRLKTDKQWRLTMKAIWRWTIDDDLKTIWALKKKYNIVQSPPTMS